MHILLAVDLVAQPEDLVRRGVPWASVLGARLSLGASLDLRFDSDQLFGPAEASSQAIRLVGLQHAARDRLSELLQEEVPLPVRGGMFFGIGDPTQTICDFAADGVDLIAVGSHRRRGLKRLFLGSVAEKVVRRAPVPVLVLSSLDAAPPTLDHPTRVLVPIDAAEPDGAALAWLLSRLPKATLLPVYALPWTPRVEGRQLVRSAAEDDLRAWAESRLREVLGSAGRPDLEPILAQSRGESIGDTISRVAEEQNVDLIALPTHGRSGLDEWALGSTAERLVRATPRSVLVVR